ncbi:MAG: HAD family hydrolase, partial [Candidatus Acidiferrales bacterium]
HLDVRDGLWTGKIAGEHMCGGAKQHAIIRLAAAHSLNLTRSFAYGDSVGDLPMLENVGYPAAVNPSKNLERAARIRNWPILRWRETQNVRGENLCDAARPLPLLGVNFMQFTNFPGRNR